MDSINNNNDFESLFNSIKREERDKKKKQVETKCEKCDSKDLIDKYGFFICKNCGNKCYSSISSTQE